MIAVIGLGNPGQKYQHTRHNVGFQVLDLLSARYDLPFLKSRCRSVVAEGHVAGQRLALLKPQTFMNLSGVAVREALDWYKLLPEEVLIISDDVDLPAGQLRIRPHGGAGTHNGWRSIIQETGSDRFPRIRIGVGAAPPEWDLADWVLSSFGEQKPLMEEAYHLADEAADCFIRHGIDLAMNRYNAKRDHAQGTP